MLSHLEILETFLASLHEWWRDSWICLRSAKHDSPFYVSAASYRLLLSAECGVIHVLVSGSKSTLCLSGFSVLDFSGQWSAESPRGFFICSNTVDFLRPQENLIYLTVLCMNTFKYKHGLEWRCISAWTVWWPLVWVICLRGVTWHSSCILPIHCTAILNFPATKMSALYSGVILNR